MATWPVFPPEHTPQSSKNAVPTISLLQSGIKTLNSQLSLPTLSSAKKVIVSWTDSPESICSCFVENVNSGKSTYSPVWLCLFKLMSKNVDWLNE